jgi:polyisoprenoid-binding protein YceI
MIREAVKWIFEPTHCKIGFSVKHFGITETEGHFKRFEGTIESVNEDFSDARVELTIDVNSLDTQDEQRDDHLRSADFFDVDKFPVIHFQSTGTEVVRANQYKMFGELSMVGITKPVVLDVQHTGIVKRDPFGNTKAGFLIQGQINRKDWGINWNAVLDFGGVAVGETVNIRCHVELLRS